MMSILLAMVTGALFTIGLIISHMIYPTKIWAFLDVAGNWDPSLAFVMVSAIAIVVVGYRLILKREKPLFAAKFDVHLGHKVSAKLVFGSALFGIGWGVSGLCPGPLVALLGSGLGQTYVLFVAIIVGIWLSDLVFKHEKD